MSRFLINCNGAAGNSGQLAALPSSTSSVVSNGVGGGGGGSGLESANDVRRLQDDVNQLTKRNGGLSFLCPFSTFFVDEFEDDD